MPIYVAMLRGINVSGHKIIKMEDLRASFLALGLRGVKTHVQSGNVIFEAAKNSSADLSKQIAASIQRDFGFAVPVILKTAKELERVIQSNPFAKMKSVDPARLHVTFLSKPAPKDASKKLDALAHAPDQFRLGAQEIYLHCPDGYGRTKLSNVALERALSVGATTRNWKTVNSLLEMASERAL